MVVYRSPTANLPEYRTPFQGASSFDVYPGLKPLGYSVRPLRDQRLQAAFRPGIPHLCCRFRALSAGVGFPQA
jgi:hypothetical protein